LRFSTFISSGSPASMQSVRSRILPLIEATARGGARFCRFQDLAVDDRSGTLPRIYVASISVASWRPAVWAHPSTALGLPT
jgi:hypothetical protein